MEILVLGQIKESSKNFTCSVCSKGFKRKGQLNRHFLIHTGEKPWECSVCKHRFNQKDSMKRHMLIVHGIMYIVCLFVVSKKHVCPLCEKAFKGKGDLTRHLRIHTGEKPFKCEICGRSFTQKSVLKSHSITVHNIVPSDLDLRYNCSVCGKMFRAKGDLTRHFRIHTGEKPFECSVCKRRFNDRGNRKKHMVTHIGQMNI
ncbi:ZN554-like protein [Mya arenaria]|uniref:ZN554-like protein n=1 Tax=Mya arenaria TaxID=6604 RepID=A0ABY7F4Q0_MYAAR|nr:ZN554-like protein [Mya arenaria]